MEIEEAKGILRWNHNQQVKRGLYNTSRLIALDKLRKGHRQEFLALVHEERRILTNLHYERTVNDYEPYLEEAPLLSLIDQAERVKYRIEKEKERAKQRRLNKKENR